jgi:hypothetical protein
MAAGPEFCWPSVRSFVAVYPEDFMAADIVADSRRGWSKFDRRLVISLQRRRQGTALSPQNTSSVLSARASGKPLLRLPTSSRDFRAMLWMSASPLRAGSASQPDGSTLSLPPAHSIGPHVKAMASTVALPPANTPLPVTVAVQVMS